MHRATSTKALPPIAPNVERDAVPLADLATPADLAREYPNVFTEAGLRGLLRQRLRNGLDRARAVLIVRNRQVIVRSRFERWLAEQVA
jgi:hypothetical protein